jgi:hypothetical protein
VADEPLPVTIIFPMGHRDQPHHGRACLRVCLQNPTVIEEQQCRNVRGAIRECEAGIDDKSSIILFAFALQSFHFKNIRGSTINVIIAHSCDYLGLQRINFSLRHNLILNVHHKHFAENDRAPCRFVAKFQDLY